MTKAEIEAQLSSATGRFYVYCLFKPDGTPFYVGKGQDRRVFFHESEAKGAGLSHKLNTIRHIISMGQALGYEIVKFYEREDECNAREVAEILRIGRHDLKTGPLTNLTSGGEGTSGLSEETKRRIDADLHGPNAPGERGIANRFFLKLNEARSVPVRPASTFTPIALVPHRQPKTPSERMAAALAASAIANRVLLEPGCVIPRRMWVEDTEMIIENGTGASILEAGMATLLAGQTAGDEKFVMNAQGVSQVVALSNRDLLLDAGILMPAD